MKHGGEIDMEQNSIANLFPNSVEKLRAAHASCSQPAAELEAAAHDFSLTALLAQERRCLAEWGSRLASLAPENSDPECPVVAALNEVARQELASARDDTTMDLGIVSHCKASLSLLGTHFTAAARYARQTGQEEAAVSLDQCRTEAEELLERFEPVVDRLVVQVPRS